jgi:hypothetical protein
MAVLMMLCVVVTTACTTASIATAAATTNPAQLNPIPLWELTNSAQAAFLYSKDFGEVTAAQKNNGLKLTGQQPVAYVLSGSASDTKPIYRLKQKSTGSWLMSVSTDQVNALVNIQKSFTNEGVTGNIYKEPGFNTKEIHRYSNGKAWRLSFTALAGYHDDGAFGYLPQTYYQVGAYYFGAFDVNDPNDPFLIAVDNKFHRYPDPWGGVRDFHGDPDSQWGPVPQNTQGWAGDWSYLKPSIGYYDDSQVATLEKQIDQAASSGLSYFSFYDYWNDQKGATSGDKALNAFTQASNTNRMKFMLSLVLPGDNNNDAQHLRLPVSQFNAAAEAYSGYMTRGNYLTTPDGRPMVFMEDGGGIGSGSVADQNTFINLLKQKIKAKSGRDAYIVNHTEHEAAFQTVGDAYGCLNIGQYVNAGSYSNYIKSAPGYFNSLDTKGKPFMRCGMSGFNEAPRAGFWAADGTIRYFKDDTKAQFPAAMSMTLGNMQSQPASLLTGYMTMYAWNEWHEGGIIEPNVRDGYYYLDMLRQIFGLTPR